MPEPLLIGWAAIAEALGVCEREARRHKAELMGANMVIKRRIGRRRWPYYCAFESHLKVFVMQGGMNILKKK